MVGLRAAVLGIGVLVAGCTQPPPPPPAPAGSPAPPVASPVASVTPALAPTVAPTAPVASQATAPPGPVATASAPNPIAPALRPGEGTPVSRPFFLQMTAPLQDTLEVPAGSRSIVVAGRTTPGAVVSVNGTLANVDEAGSFEAEVALTDEVTLVEVVASDGAGREVRVDRVIVRE